MTKQPSRNSGKAPKDPHVDKPDFSNPEITERMKLVKHKIMVLSGKGGVGKSTVAVNLACALAWQGHQVGILDADIHGPDVPKMLGTEGTRLMGGESGLEPAIGPLNIRIVSMDFLLQTADTPVIWRGPLKMRVLSEFLSKVNWGQLDYLVIDLPPGTGDESLSIMQLLPDLDGVIIVTTPQEVALLDSRKAANMVKQMQLPILGIVENMSGFHCPHCGKVTNIFGKDGGRNAAKELNIFFLGALPFDHRVMTLSDEGKPFIVSTPDTPVAKAFQAIVERLLPRLGRRRTSSQSSK
jgi:ATP-binding protein involved in chromosome partitioning